MCKVGYNNDYFEGINNIRVTNTATGEVKIYSKEYLNILKWINILENEKEIDSEELKNDLNIWIVEDKIDMFPKNKDVKGYYVKGASGAATLLCVNSTIENTYDIIKLMLLKIFQGKSNFEICI